MEKMLRIIKRFGFLFPFSIFLSCHNPVEPGNISPGRRDYIWTVDTLPNYSYISKIWGNSPTDVWVIGQPGDFSKTIYHFNGRQWQTDNIFRYISPNSIYGFAVNNVWIGGSD